MENEELRQIISQIKKYDLVKEFDTVDSFNNWVKGLDDKQIANFISLTVDPSQITFPKKILINADLLKCDDYIKRIEAMLKLNPSIGNIRYLCKPNFLSSPHYYEDMEMLSTVSSKQFPLWAVTNDAFISSPYHTEDLKLIIEAKDIEGLNRDDLVAEALAYVACAANSIESGYHQKDMDLIAHSGSRCLQSANSYPERSINNLAVNYASLNDKHHLENMQILAKCRMASELLYEVMTSDNHIHGQYFREEIEALSNAKSEATALALFCYITNATRSPSYYASSYNLNVEIDYKNYSPFILNNDVPGSFNPKYLSFIKLLSNTDDTKIFFIESLLVNDVFATSRYCEYDLELLQSITDMEMFVSVYMLIINEVSILTDHHIQDIELVMKTTNEDLRRLLIEKASKKDIKDSPYYNYDMNFIANLDLNTLDQDTKNAIRYYLLNVEAANHPQHIERLETLARGESIDTNSDILNHLEFLEQNPETITMSPVILDDEEVSDGNNPKAFSKFIDFFRRKRH